MITFRPMLQGEFPAYLAYFIPDYAAEIAANYRVAEADARVQAEREIAQDLPEGPQTAGQDLFCILDGTGKGDLIGYVWYRTDRDRRSVFICDFCILPDHRGQGRGREALGTFESLMGRQGYREIRLRVAADNARAQHVYAVGGFRVTGVNMSKHIGAETDIDGLTAEPADTGPSQRRE